MFDGAFTNSAFILVSVVTFGLQIFLVQLGGDFVRTSPLTMIQWLVTIGLGALGLPVGVMMRFIPVKEDPEAYFTADSILLEDLVPEKTLQDGDTLDIELNVRPIPQNNSNYSELRPSRDM